MSKFSKEEIINKFAVSLLRQNSLADLLWDMAKKIGELLSFEDCVIYLKENDVLIQKATYGIKNPALRTIKNPVILSFGEGIAGSVALTKKAELIPDVSNDERYISDEFSGKSEIAIPLIYEEEVIGVIDCESPELNGFSESDFDLLKTICAIATPRIVSAFEQRQKEKAEKELIIAVHQAEQANHAKTKFLTNMSHELRTPLNAILGFSQLLDINQKDPLSIEQKHKVNLIIKEGNYLLELINQVFDLAKIEEEKLTLNKSDVCVNKVCLECLDMVIIKANDQDIKIKTDLSAVHSIYVDETRLKKILINLLTNAIKYNQKSGSLWITTKDISSRRVRISVKDNGIGIAKDKQNEIFEPFNRLGNEASNIKGTGIGMTITKEFVESMAGHMGFLSEESKGSEFWVEFPSKPSN